MNTPDLPKIGIISLFIGGLISIIISTFGCKLNYLGSIIGYVLIGTSIISVIFHILTSKQTTSTILTLMPFLIFIGSILGLLIIIGTNDKFINNYTVSMDYYSYNNVALIILLISGFIFIKEIYFDYTKAQAQVNIYYILIILSLCFFANFIIIKDVLQLSTTDEKNTCYINS